MHETPETQVPSLGGEGSPGKGMATHSSILAWRIPQTEEPGGLQAIGSQWVGHDRAHTLADTPCIYRQCQVGVKEGPAA